MKFVMLTAVVLLTTACAHKDKIVSVAKDNAKPVYENCVKEYQQTMSDSDARSACTEKLKAGYKAATSK